MTKSKVLLPGQHFWIIKDAELQIMSEKQPGIATKAFPSPANKLCKMTQKKKSLAMEILHFIKLLITAIDYGFYLKFLTLYPNFFQ